MYSEWIDSSESGELDRKTGIVDDGSDLDDDEDVQDDELDVE